jgi:hypothetical protein
VQIIGGHIMPNHKAKDRKRFKRKLNASLNRYGRTRLQIKRKLRQKAEKEKTYD